MYEYSVVKSIMQKINLIAAENPGMEAVEIKIRWGARCGAVAATLRKLFARVKKGTVARNAILTIENPEQGNDAWAADILLEGVKLEKLVDVPKKRSAVRPNPSKKV